MERQTEFTVELLFFNDLKSLERCIPTFIDYVDSVIAVDGMHRTDRLNDFLSDDGSREYLKSFGKVELINGNGYYEVTKRKLVKNMCKTLNLLIIDSDEYVIGDWEKFFSNYEKIRKADKNNLNLYKLKLQRLDSTELFSYHPVVYYKPWEFTYYQNKHNIPIKKAYQLHSDIFAPQSYHKPINGITLMHDHKLRSSKHMKIRQRHLDWLSSQIH